jgi:hypothetical protein
VVLPPYVVYAEFCINDIMPTAGLCRLAWLVMVFWLVTGVPGGIWSA